MTFLLDTHLLLWSAVEPSMLTSGGRALISNPEHSFVFSAASVWEIAIKRAKRPDIFAVDPDLLQAGLLDLGYTELPVISAHGVATLQLPMHHRDPFDRILIAQSIVEGLTLATVDSQIARYAAPIEFVG